MPRGASKSAEKSQNASALDPVWTSCCPLFKPSGDLAHGPRQVLLDAVLGLLGRAPKEHHDNERVGATYEKVYQGVLVHPVDLSKKPADPIALDAALSTRARGKSNLKRHVLPEGLAFDDAAEHPHAAYRNGLNVVPASVEQRPNEPPPL